MDATVEREVIGVDFSGAAADNNTWAAQGRLTGDSLVLTRCQLVSRAELTVLLESRGRETVAALDFPFSVPEGFAGFWVPGAGSMPRLWSEAAAMEYRDFLGLRDAFVAAKGEPKRLCDQGFPRVLLLPAQGQPQYGAHDLPGHAVAAPAMGDGLRCAAPYPSEQR